MYLVPNPLNAYSASITATNKDTSQMSKMSLGWHYFTESHS